MSFPALLFLGLALLVGVEPARAQAPTEPPAPEAAPRAERASPFRYAKLGPNDPWFQGDRASTATGPAADQWGLRAIGLRPAGSGSAWDIETGASSAVVVAVIDTGLDYLHPDLARENLWRNPRELPNGIDDDGDGKVDDLIGWSFVEDDNNPWDPVGHGTHVAGVIAATSDNGEGIAGINRGVRIMPLRALNAAGRGRSSDIAAAIYYAVRHGARIINLSLGGDAITEVERRAVAHATSRGVLVVTPAGNTASSTESFGIAALPGVLTVAATDRDGLRAPFSGFGREVDLAAPGVEILSLRARGSDLLRISEAPGYAPGSAVVGEQGRYYVASGTSFAAPFVSGVASLVLARSPTLDGRAVARVLLNSATDIDAPGVDQRTGYGLVDARAALIADPSFFVEAEITSIEISRDASGARLQVRGRVDADAFEGAYVEVAPGDAPPEDAWRGVGGSIVEPVRDALLVELDTEEIGGEGLWSVRVVTVHQDGRRREARALVELGP